MNKSIRRLVAAAAIAAAAVASPLAAKRDVDAGHYAWATTPVVGGGAVWSSVTNPSDGEWFRLIRGGASGTKVMWRDYVATDSPPRTLAARLECGPHIPRNRFVVLDEAGFLVSGWSPYVNCR